MANAVEIVGPDGTTKLVPNSNGSVTAQLASGASVAVTTSDGAPLIIRRAADDGLADDTRAILVELRVISRLLASGLSVTDDVDSLRADESAGLGV